MNPCADPNRQVPVTADYTTADDGLIRPWHGRVFVTPPYGRPIGAWVHNCLAEYAAGCVTEATVLLPARVDTRWFRRFAGHPVAFWRGRPRFPPPGSRRSPPRSPAPWWG